MGNTKLQQCFSLFYVKDEFRQKFFKPLTWNDKVFATDGHTLIYVDKKNIDFEFENEFETPTNLDSIIPEPNINIILNVSDLEQYKTTDELKSIGSDVKCSECNGDGEVEWEHERWTRYFDCPKCNGDGFESYAKMIPTGNKTFRDIKLKIKENYLDIIKFKKVIDVQKIIGGNIELMFCEKDKNALLFRVGICYVIIMKSSSINDESEIIELL